MNAPTPTGHYAIELNGGTVTMSVHESDGTMGHIDLSDIAASLLELGAIRPRSETELEAATVELGVLACDDGVRFLCNGEEIDPVDGLELISDAIYRSLMAAVRAHLGEDSSDASTAR